MNNLPVDLNLLVLFDAVLRHRSVSRAAAAVGLSQPAVSNGLRRLREHFHDRLFVRTAEGMMPSPRPRRSAGRSRPRSRRSAPGSPGAAPSTRAPSSGPSR